MKVCRSLNACLHIGDAQIIKLIFFWSNSIGQTWDIPPAAGIPCAGFPILVGLTGLVRTLQVQWQNLYPILRLQCIYKRPLILLYGVKVGKENTTKVLMSSSIFVAVVQIHSYEKRN